MGKLKLTVSVILITLGFLATVTPVVADEITQQNSVSFISVEELTAEIQENSIGFADESEPFDESSDSEGGMESFRLISETPEEAAILAEVVPGAVITIENDFFTAVDIPMDSREETVQAAQEAKLTDVFVDTKFERMAVYPNDPFFANDWGSRMAFFPQAWGQTMGSPNTVIAILDSGVVTNRDLPVGKVRPGKTFFPGHPARTSPNSGYDSIDAHGTLSAVVAAGVANNGVGTAGGCPNCSILPVRVFPPIQNSGTTLSLVADGILWAVDNGADIISLSLGGNEPSSILTNVVDYARSKGVTVVAAAGNQGGTRLVYPAALPNVIGVAAHDSNSRLFDYSSRGTTNAFVAAPSCIDVLGTQNNRNNYCGTSASAPFVAGLAGLMVSLNRNADVQDILAKTSTPMSSVRHGKINAHKAVLLARGINVPDTHNTTRCGFRDVPTNSYYAQAACWLKANNITTGYGGRTDTFAPGMPVDRAQMAAFLYRKAGSPAASTSCGFRDVPGNAYYARAACWLKANNITTGYGGRTDTFAPGVPVDRAQMSAFLWRKAGQPRITSSCGFQDVPTNSYYAQATCWLKTNSITTGMGGNMSIFAPGDTVTRAQMSAFLLRAYMR